MNMQRRKFLINMTFAILYGKYSATIASANQQQTAAIEWHVPADRSLDIQESLEFNGIVVTEKKNQENSRSIPLIYILVGSVALGSLAETLLKVYRDWKYGGIIVTRNSDKKIIIRSIPNLERGIIIIDNGKDLKIAIQERDRPQLKELVDSLELLIKK